jgi:hypothetical protein
MKRRQFIEIYMYRSPLPLGTRNAMERSVGSSNKLIQNYTLKAENIKRFAEMYGFRLYLLTLRET